MTRFRFRALMLVLLALCIVPVIAQSDCPAIVQTVLENLDSICDTTGRNEACYGNLSMVVTPQEGVSEFNFETVGDIEGVAKINAIRLSPLNEDQNLWGVALMRLQANLPDTLPGENVTFLLFGDVEIVNAVSSEDENARPMQAFYLRTGIGDAACAEAPESGVMVRTPEGRGEIAFSVNGIDVAMGSNIFFQAQPGGNLKAKVFKGSLGVQTPDGVFGSVAGTEMNIPMGDNLLPSGPPEPLVTYDEEVNNLPEEVFGEIAPPLEEEQVELVNNLINNGIAPCGTAPFLPACDELIETLGGDKCPVDDTGEENCDIEPETLWEEVVDTEYEDVSMWDEYDSPSDEATEEPTEEGPTATPRATATPVPTATQELPPGCEPGICLKDPAEACKCALCGVTCPEGSTGSGGSNAEATSAADCAANPSLPGCQTSDPPPDQPPGDQPPLPTDCGPAGCALPTEFPTAPPEGCPAGQIPNPFAPGTCIDAPE